MTRFLQQIYVRPNLEPPEDEHVPRSLNPKWYNIYMLIRDSVKSVSVGRDRSSASLSFENYVISRLVRSSDRSLIWVMNRVYLLPLIWSSFSRIINKCTWTFQRFQYIFSLSYYKIHIFRQIGINLGNGFRRIRSLPFRIFLPIL